MRLTSATPRVPALAVAALALSGLAATTLAPSAWGRPAPAEAAAGSTAATCSIDGIAPAVVVVGLSTVSPTWSVTTSGCTISDWTLTLPHGLGSVTQAAPKRNLRASALKNAWAGANTAKVAVTDVSGPVTGSASFSLKRRSAWAGVKARPQPVDGGDPLTFSGTLKLADWNKHSYVTYPGRKVQLQFRAVGKKTWKTIKTVRTTSGQGFVSTHVSLGSAGSVRLSWTDSTNHTYHSRTVPVS